MGLYISKQLKVLVLLLFIVSPLEDTRNYGNW